MSVERTIANYLLIAREDLSGARLLAASGNRNAAYLAEQAAEKTIRAVLTSEGLHAGVRHDLRVMVDLVPEQNLLKPTLAALVALSAYATTFRYPTSRRIPAAPRPETLERHLADVATALEAVATALGVDLANADARATRPGPVR